MRTWRKRELSEEVKKRIGEGFGLKRHIPEGLSFLRPRLNLFTKLTFSMWIVGGSLVKIWAWLFLGFGLG